MDDVHFLRTHASSVDRELLLDSTRAKRYRTVEGMPYYRFAVPDTRHVVRVTLVRAFVPSNPRNVRPYASSLVYSIVEEESRGGTTTTTTTTTPPVVLTLPPGRYDRPSDLAPYMLPDFTYDPLIDRWKTTTASIRVRFAAGENPARLCVLLGLPVDETWVGDVFPHRGTLSVDSPRGGSSVSSGSVVAGADVEYAAIRVIGHMSETETTVIPTGMVYQAHVLPHKMLRHPIGIVTYFDVAMNDRYGDPYDTDGCPFWIVLHARVLSLQDVCIRADTFNPSIAPDGYVPHAGLYAQHEEDEDEYDFEED